MEEVIAYIKQVVTTGLTITVGIGLYEGIIKPSIIAMVRKIKGE